MANEEDVLKISKKLEKMTGSADSAAFDSGAAVDMLKALEGMKMTLEVLQRTKIGVIVNNLRRSTDDSQCSSLARVLIKNWKKLLPESTGKSGTSVTNGGPKEADKKDSSSAPPSKPSQQLKIARSLSASDTKDAVRLKCREMLSSSLLGNGDDIPEGSADPEQLGAALEEAIFAEFKNTDAKYKTKIRSRVANLRDKKNPQLRENVLLGHISPEKFARMSADEMASAEMKKLREQLTKEAINDAQMATSAGTTTDLLKCGKCGKRNVTYNQMQTRSADEPMTTFCFCNECGHRWKFC